MLVVAGVAAFGLMARFASAAPRLPEIATPDAADLIITKTVAPGQVIPGQPATYTVLLRNLGTITATSVVITDPLPSTALIGRSRIFCSGPGPTVCQPAVVYVGRTLSATVDAVGPSTLVTVTINITPTQLGNVVNVATVSSAEVDDNPATNVATATLVVTGTQTFAALVAQQPSP
jgi:uncharacterized repeat protein (TIGR01451 family)